MTKVFAVLAGLSAASIWGGMYVVSKVVLEVIPPFSLLSLRLILGSVALAAVLIRRSPGWPSARNGAGIITAGAVGFGFSLGLQFIGTKLSTAANASLVTSASPIFMVFFAAWLLKEPITLRRLVALLVASLGVIAVVDPRSGQLETGSSWGNLALVGAAVSWGLYSVMIRRVSFEMGTLEISLMAFLGGLIVALPIAGLEVRAIDIDAVGAGVVLGVLYLGLVSTALAMYLWNKSLALLEAGAVSLLFFAQPVVGAGLGAALLGEQLTSGFWVGAVLIAAGLAISTGPLGVGWSRSKETGRQGQA